MHVAVRSYLTAGVALVGAGAIVAAPITPSPPDIQIPTIHASAVQLAAMANPIQQWVDVLGTAFTNVVGIGGAVVADPAPVLRQIITNQLGYGQTLVTGLQGTTEAFLTWATEDVPNTLREMATAISQGNIVGAANALNSLVGSLLFVGFPLFDVLAIPGQITDNLTNAVKAITGLGTLLPVVIGVLGPVEGIISAIGDTGQALVNAIGAGNPLGALGALINAPAVLTGALLNGYTSVAGDAFPGLLTFNPGDPFNGGLVQTLFVTIPQAIAAALTPAPAATLVARTSLAAAVAPADAASVPELTAATITLDAPSSTPAVEEAQPAVDAVEPKTEAAADVTTATEKTATEETEASTVQVASTTASDTPDTRTDTKDGNKVVPGEVNAGVSGTDTSTSTSTTTTSTSTTSAGDQPTSTPDEKAGTSEAGTSAAGSSDAGSSSGRLR